MTDDVRCAWASEPVQGESLSSSGQRFLAVCRGLFGMRCERRTDGDALIRGVRRATYTPPRRREVTLPLQRVPAPGRLVAGVPASSTATPVYS